MISSIGNRRNLNPLPILNFFQFVSLFQNHQPIHRFFQWIPPKVFGGTNEKYNNLHMELIPLGSSISDQSLCKKVAISKFQSNCCFCSDPNLIWFGNWFSVETLLFGNTYPSSILLSLANPIKRTYIPFQIFIS